MKLLSSCFFLAFLLASLSVCESSRIERFVPKEIKNAPPLAELGSGQHKILKKKKLHKKFKAIVDEPITTSVDVESISIDSQEVSSNKDMMSAKFTPPKVEQTKKEKIQVQKKNVAAQKVQTKNVAAQKVQKKNVAAQKVQTKNVAAQKVQTKNVSAQKVQTKNVAAQKVQTNNVAAQKVQTKNVAAQKVQTKNVAAQKIQDIKKAKVQENHMNQFKSLLETMNPNTLASSMVSLLMESSGNINYKGLYIAMDMLMNSLQDSLNKENERFKKETDNHQKRINNYNSIAKSSKDGITEGEKEQSTLSESLDKMIKEFNTMKSNIKSSTDHIEDLHSKRRENKADYDKLVKELDNLIKIINEAVGLLRSLETHGTALLEFRKGDFFDIINLLQVKLTKPSTKNTVSLMINGFMSLTSSVDRVDQEKLKLVINMLLSFQTKIEGERSTRGKIEEEEKKNYQKDLARYNDILKELRKVKNGLDNKINEEKKQLLKVNVKLAADRGNLNNALGAITSEKKSYDSIQKSHIQTVSDYSKEIAIVNKCFQVLAAGGVIRPKSL